MKQVLYRKYRPKTFEDVVGQEHITSVLLNEIKENKVAHAYLFTGSRGTGKTTLSKILAKAVNCLNPHNGSPCGECEICKSIDDGSQFDVVEMDAASNNRVDDVRILRQEAVYAPAQCRYRVYIIDEAHMLTTSAFNALLKIMEEPPEHVIFILATTEAHKIPATILSRCQSFEFKRFSVSDITRRLDYISKEEGFNLNPDAALLIAKLARGGMRDAVSILDMCASKSNNITYEVVSSTAGLAKNEQISEMADNLISGNFPELLKNLDKAYEGVSDPQRICQQLIEHFRQIMLSYAANDVDSFTGDISLYDIIKEQAQKTSLNRVLEILTELQKALDFMNVSSNKDLSLETALIKLVNIKSSADNKLLDRISALEKKVDRILSGAVSIDFDSPKPEKPQATLVNVEERTKKDAVPLKQWQEILDILENENPPLYGSLDGSKAYVCGNILLIECENEFFLTLVRKNEFARNCLRDIAERVTGKIFKLGPFKADRYNITSDEDPLDNFINKLSSSLDELELK